MKPLRRPGCGEVQVGEETRICFSLLCCHFVVAPFHPHFVVFSAHTMLFCCLSISLFRRSAQAPPASKERFCRDLIFNCLSRDHHFHHWCLVGDFMVSKWTPLLTITSSRLKLSQWDICTYAHCFYEAFFFFKTLKVMSHLKLTWILLHRPVMKVKNTLDTCC